MPGSRDPNLPEADKVAPPEGDRAAFPTEPIDGRALLQGGDEVPCSVVMRSPSRGDVRADASVEPGEVVICYLDRVGILVGTVEACRADGFSVAFALKGDRLVKVAAQLERHAARAERTAQLRRAPRIVPQHRSVEVRLAEKVVFYGTILDISMYGVAIALQPDPGLFVGALVRVGSRPAKVIRLLRGGAAVQFIEPLPADSFDERIRL